MSAQGATLRGGAVHIPIWPVAVVVLAATAAVIGLSTIDATIDGVAPARTLTTVTDAQRLANSTAAIREQGAVIPVAVDISQVTPSAVGFAGFENPGAYASQLPGYAGFQNPGAYPTQLPAGFENPGAYATELPAFAGFENPGAYATQLPAYAGFENPGAYPTVASESDFTSTTGARPGMVGGEICGQCR